MLSSSRRDRLVDSRCGERNNERDAVVAVTAAFATESWAFGSATGHVRHPRPSTGGMMVLPADTAKL